MYPALRLTTVGFSPLIAFVVFRQPIYLSTWSAGINHTDRSMSSVAFAAFGSRIFANLGLAIIYHLTLSCKSHECIYPSIIHFLEYFSRKISLEQL